jgi:hypothetical protein
MSVWYGDSGSSITPDRIENLPQAASGTSNTTVYAQRVLQSQVQNPDLYIEFRVNTNAGVNTSYGNELDDVVVKAYKYAEIQDYHVGPLASLGLRNQKYDGCKLVASDYNEDSPDTIDKGPVITIIEGPAVDLKVNPNTKGTYTFR